MSDVPELTPPANCGDNVRQLVKIANGGRAEGFSEHDVLWSTLQGLINIVGTLEAKVAEAQLDRLPLLHTSFYSKLGSLEERMSQLEGKQ